MMTSRQSAPHVDDERLAALQDGELPEREAAAVREHLGGCQDCRARQRALTDIGERLAVAPAPDPELVQRVRRQVEREAEARTSSRAWMVAVPALAAAAGIALLLWPGGRLDEGRGALPKPPLEDDGWQVRGGPGAQRSVVFTLHRMGAALERLDDGAELRAGTHRLAVEIKHLPARDPRSIAVYAREPGGRVTWIRPTWTDAAARPSCLQLPAGAGVLPPSEGVELGLAPGKVEIGLLVLSGSCALEELDQRLEAGWTPRAGADNVISAGRIQLTISAD